MFEALKQVQKRSMALTSDESGSTTMASTSRTFSSFRDSMPLQNENIVTIIVSSIFIVQLMPVVCYARYIKAIQSSS